MGAFLYPFFNKRTVNRLQSGISLKVIEQVLIFYSCVPILYIVMLIKHS